MSVQTGGGGLAEAGRRGRGGSEGSWTQPYLAEYLQEETPQHEPLEPSSVSDVCSHYFAAGSEALEEEHDARLIAASRDEFRWIPLAVGMAVPRRSPGCGAARAGLIKALLTDEDTANGCLEVTDVA